MSKSKFLKSHLKNLSTYRWVLGVSCEIGRKALWSINVIDIHVVKTVLDCFHGCIALTRLRGGTG